MTDPEATHSFRYGGQMAFLVAASGMALMLLLLLTAVIGPGFEPASLDLLWLILGVGFLAGLSLLPLWLRRRAPVILRVGPKGLELPIMWTAPLPWHDIHRIRLLRQSRAFSRVVVLRIDLLAGRMPPYRFAFGRKAELWFLRKAGLRLPISSLDAPPEAIIASIERFRPVPEPPG